MAEVICYGSIAIDELLWLPRWPAPGDDLHPVKERICLGGTALNVALPLAAWGHQVAIGGNYIGDDEHGRLIRKRLAGTSLDHSALVVEPGRRTALCTLLIGPEGERTIIGRAFAEAAAGPLPPLAGARCLSLDNYGPGRQAAAERARATGLLIVGGDLNSLADPLVGLCDVVILSAAHTASKQADCAPIEYAARLRAAGPRFVALTDGPHVALLFTNGRVIRARPQGGPIRDTTGAGDSFRAGLIHALLEGWPPERALAFAVAAGSLRCRRAGGAEDPPTLQEVAELAGQIGTWE